MHQRGIINLKNTMGVMRRVLIIAGFALLVMGMCLFFLNARLGTTMRDYTVKSGKQYSMIEANGIAVDSEKNIYCLSNYWSAVNVFSPDGSFLYSLVVPEYQNGRGGMFVYNGLLYVFDKQGNIYYYDDGVFQGRTEQDYDLKVYDKKNALWFAIACPGDELGYIPLLIDQDFLYLERTDGQLLVYQEGILISEEPLNDEEFEQDNPICAYAENTVWDDEGNMYSVRGMAPRLVKVSPDGETTVITADPFFEWVAHEPFACLPVAAAGILLLTLSSRLKGKKDRDIQRIAEDV
jgi:hypothetical protein